MEAAAVATAASATIAVFALGFGLTQYRQGRRQQLLADLQSNKEAAAAVAARVRHGKLPRRKRNREELLEAMCLAAVLGQSGPYRSLLYAALAKAMAAEEHRKHIASSMADIQTVISRNSPYTDLVQARLGFFALRAALSVNDDLRVRVELAAGIALGHVDDMSAPDERCTDETHRWGALKEVLAQRESVVVVCPRLGPSGYAPGCATLALDFHKVAKRPRRALPTTPADAMALGQLDQLPIPVAEGFRLTELAKRIHRAKYDGSVADLKSIAGELASVISCHPTYKRAEIIAAIPGRSHDFSAQLGTEVSGLVSKSCIVLTGKPKASPDLIAQPGKEVSGRLVPGLAGPSPSQDRSGATPEFALVLPDSVKGREVILIDDVYRTGDTLRDAAEMLRRAGARQVLGLTATCTVSAIVPAPKY